MISKNLEEYAAAIRGSGLRATEPRIAILRHLSGDPSDHYTVEGIYGELRTSHPSLSKTTVYNTLQALRRVKLVHAISITEGEMLYGLGDGNHHHFYCRVCGSIEDVQVACPLLGKMVKEAGVVEEIHGYFKGVCKSCKGSE